MKEKTGNLIDRLCYIGIELSAQKDVDRLLELILTESMSISNSDAGSIYFIEGEEQDKKLVFKYAENRSVSFPFKQFELSIDKRSIAGACVVEKKGYNFNSMDETLEVLGIEHNRSFDEVAGYETINMLVIPLKNYEGDVIGVLQLINKMADQSVDNTSPNTKIGGYKERIVPFTSEDEKIIGALASQAAILMERRLLFIAIEQLLDSTIFALVKALDKRDPVTSGHSERVAKYAKALYQFIQQKHDSRYENGMLSEEGAREIYIAGLLHDVGKIGVPEYLLMKENKLSLSEMDAIKSRFKYIQLLLQMKTEKGNITDSEKSLYDTLTESHEKIVKINKAGFLNDEDEQWLKNLSEINIQSFDGEDFQVLSPYELEQLLIKRGNLTDEERLKINLHAKMSLDILKEIQWTKELKHIPQVAAQHHEKLNGKGYPTGLMAKDLSLMARMIAIADITMR